MLLKILLLCLLFPACSQTEELTFSKKTFVETARLSPVWVDHDSVKAIWERESFKIFQLKQGRFCWTLFPDTLTTNLYLRTWSVHDSLNSNGDFVRTIPDTLFSTCIFYFNFNLFGRSQYPRQVWK